jgi:hypothetical protein
MRGRYANFWAAVSYQTVQLLPQASQNAKTSLPHGVGSHPQRNGNVLVSLALYCRALKALPRVLVKVSTHQVKRTTNDPLPRGLRVWFLVKHQRAIRVGQFLVLVAQRNCWLVPGTPKIEPHLVHRDRPKPSVKDATLLKELTQICKDGAEHLLNSVGSVALL